MSKGQRPNPQRRRGSTPHSTNFKVDNGKTDVGYLAGECYGCNGHRTYAHKPCHRFLTEGELSCPLCASGMVPEWRGYVPVWDRDFALRYALINETYLESVDMIPFGAQVVLSRAKPVKSPLVIRAAEDRLMRALPDKLPYNTPVDMYAICRLLWKDPVIDAWYATTHARDAGRAASAPPLNPTDFGPMYRAAAQRANEVSEQQRVNEEFAASVRRGAPTNEPKPNGKHKPK
jgi:hypothetical protein